MWQKNEHRAIELLCNLKQQSGDTKLTGIPKELIFEIYSMNSPRSGEILVSEKSPRFQEFPQIWGKMSLHFGVFLNFFSY